MKIKMRWMAATVLLLVCSVIIGTGAPASAERSGTLVRLETNMGVIVLELDEEKAPATTANFLEYVREGFYDGLIFHRVIENFMIQGGGMEPNMQEKDTRDPIGNEADNGLSNEAYTVAMARTMEPHSATAQFFINVKDNLFLNHKSKDVNGWGYAVFGKVVEGQDVVDAIKVVPTATRGFDGDVPVEPVVIERAVVVGEE